MKERDHRTEYAPPSTTRGTTAKTSTGGGGGGGGGAVWKLRDNLDCAVVFVDASQTGTHLKFFYSHILQQTILTDAVFFHANVNELSLRTN